MANTSDVVVRSSHPEVRGTARALRRQQARAQKRDNRGRSRIVEVLAAKPRLRVTFMDSGVELSEENLELGQWARQYRKKKRIRKGERLVVAEADDKWIVQDVLSKADADVSGGVSLGMSLMLSG